MRRLISLGLLVFLLIGLIASNPGTAEFRRYTEQNLLPQHKNADFTFNRMNMGLFSLHAVSLQTASICSDVILALGLGGSFVRIPKEPFMLLRPSYPLARGIGLLTTSVP